MSRNHRKSVAVRLVTATRLYRAKVGAQLAPMGLHAGQEGVLKALSLRDGQSMTEIAAFLDVQPPTITKMVARLAAHGYVEKRSSESDGRQSQVFLTEAGEAALAEIDWMLGAVEERALHGISPRKRKELGKLLRKISRNLADEAEPSGETDDPEASES